MPRIDPLQLLKCLSVLLTPDGGILSREEVPRLVNLMTKFSKKLVSKCVYVLILKNTDTELVDMFMAEGGWTLIQTWLQDAVQSGNWDLVREVLGLLLITPVDVERLKLNILPKLIKSLSRREELDGVAQLSTQLVQQWLAIVKGSSGGMVPQVQAPSVVEKIESVQKEQIKGIAKQESADVQTTVKEVEKTDTDNAKENNDPDAINASSFYKPSVRDGKLVIRKLPSVEESAEEVVVTETVPDSTEEQEEKEKLKEDKKSEKDKDKSKLKSSKSSGGSNSSRSSSSSTGSSKGRDKEKERDRDRDKDRKKSSSSSRSGSSSSKSKSGSSSSSRDKDKKDRDKDRKKSNESSKSSSSKSSINKDKDFKDKDKEKTKEKQAEKDKDTLSKIKPQAIEKLGRIPKKVNSSAPVEDKTKETKESAEVKKKSFSIGVRKDSDERPKTVKVYNSKMRSTGLEEEVKPAPPRPVKKPTPSVQLPTIPVKRPSPPRDHRDPILPPEKKLKIDKIDVPDRPGAIKLIPPKPKPAVLQESDLFMDALTAATAKKEPKKRKRRPSVTKENQSSPSSSPAREQPQTPTSPTQNGASPPLGLKNIAPINFYQDTLSTSEENTDTTTSENSENTTEENSENNTEIIEENKEEEESPPTPTDDNNEDLASEPKKAKVEGVLKGVLLHAKKKGPKRTISWKVESELVEIRYFELDETERVNVTKTFGDMAKMEMTSEREALQLSRKTVGEDLMESQIMWKIPYIIDQPESLAVPGSKSLEKDIQFAREKSILPPVYFDRRKIPDSPDEPIPENHQMSDPVLIPLEDPESQEIDLRNTPWPEPKGSPPHVEPQVPPHMFPNIPGPFNPPFNNMPPPQFQPMPPRFNGQPGVGGGPGPGPGQGPGPMGPGNFIPPNMLPNGNIMGPSNMGPSNMGPSNMGPSNMGPSNMGPPNMGPPNMVPPNMVPPNEMMRQGPMNPNMFHHGPPDGFGPGPDFPVFNQNPPNNMFPKNNFNNNRHGGNRGGNFRRGGNSGNWVRMNGPGNWKRGGSGGGGGHRGGRICRNNNSPGGCRKENCQFLHP